MTRGEFMGGMLEYIFGVKYIEFKGVKKSLLEYTKGGSFCKDCTYTSVYKNRLNEIFHNLLDEKFTEICIRKDKYSKPCSVKEYHKKAKDFIFDLKGYGNYNTEFFETIKENMTVAMVSRIYHDIIIEEIFHTEDRENSKERSDDDFDDSVKNICHSVSVFIYSELSELKTRKYKKEFFEFLVNEYTVFSELNLDEDDKIVQHHLNKKEKEVRNEYGFVNPIFADDDFFSRVNLIQQYKTDNGMFAAFADRNNMQEDDFLDLQMKLETLWGNSQSYNVLLKKEEVIEFKNTAVRIYNRFYGKNHPEYEDIIFLAAWNAHEYFIKYLFWLDFVLKSYK